MMPYQEPQIYKVGIRHQPFQCNVPDDLNNSDG